MKKSTGVFAFVLFAVALAFLTGYSSGRRVGYSQGQADAERRYGPFLKQLPHSAYFVDEQNVRLTTGGTREQIYSCSEWFVKVIFVGGELKAICEEKPAMPKSATLRMGGLHKLRNGDIMSCGPETVFNPKTEDCDLQQKAGGADGKVGIAVIRKPLS